MPADRQLIIGQTPDPHMDALAREVTKCGGSPFLYSTFPFDQTPSQLSYVFGGRALRLTLREGSEQIAGDDIAGVFWRVKWPLFGLPENNPAAADHDFQFREWERVIAALYVATPDARWLNRPPNHHAAGNKLLQLRLAQEIGLSLPATVISNDAAEIEALFEQGDVIYKTLSHPYYSDRDLILTTKIARADFEQRRETIALAPGLFQSLVPKAYELRVIVVGESVIPVMIKSQLYGHTQVDWRIDQLRPELYELTTLPPDVRSKLVDLMARLGLIYGAIDLIVTPDGDYIFLEINPGGQWLWMENLKGIPITREIAAYLVERQPMQFA